MNTNKDMLIWLCLLALLALFQDAKATSLEQNFNIGVIEQHIVIDKNDSKILSSYINLEQEGDLGKAQDKVLVMTPETTCKTGAGISLHKFVEFQGELGEPVTDYTNRTGKSLWDKVTHALCDYYKAKKIKVTKCFIMYIYCDTQ